MNIKPLADRVLILPQPAEEKTIGGIIIPDTAKEKPLQGKVVAVGNGTKDEDMVIAVGDTVLYGIRIYFQHHPQLGIISCLAQPLHSFTAISSLFSSSILDIY